MKLFRAVGLAFFCAIAAVGFIIGAGEIYGRVDGWQLARKRRHQSR